MNSKIFAISVLACVTALLFSNCKKNESIVQQRLSKKANRLIQEKSPYLLRHAFDPVDWHPWGQEAFDLAKKANKPIFLSIGYASCFACYSMQREVFENPHIAIQMNSDAINILVDREERPDIDRIYMTAIQTISGTGGWPMSLFLTPDRKPFFGATYLSAAAFTKTLGRVHELWQHNPQKLSQSGDLISSYLEDFTKHEKRNIKQANVLQKGFQAFQQLYNPQFGGFGSAPKFLHPMVLSFLMRYYNRTGEKAALEMTLTTLQQMSAGAIFDQVGYGFHRYSADNEWRTPHFEKMAYDQALMAVVYLEAYQITHDSRYSNTAQKLLSYVQREMMSPEGGFYGAQDSASVPDAAQPAEKVPGAFYTWTSSEIDQILGKPDSAIFCFLYGIRREGNSLSDPLNILKNRNVIFISHTEKEAALKFNKSESEIHAIAGSCLQKLLKAREHRPHPQTDDKIILSWNALMISAFAKAYEVMGEREYLNVAERCNQFLQQKLYSADTHTLLRRYRNGEARYEGTLQDYTFYVQSLLDLYEADFNIHHLQQAIALADEMNKRFGDPVNGAFFDTAADDKSLPVRNREFYDDSEPSGNSIAILDFLRLSQITANGEYQKIADRALQFFSDPASEQPETMPQLLTALDFNMQKPQQIIIAGTPEDPATRGLLTQIHSRFLPHAILLFADGGDAQKTLAGFLPVMSSVRRLGGKSTAYVCENYVCKLPTSDPVQLAEILDQEIPSSTHDSRR